MFFYSIALSAHGTLLFGSEIVPYERPSPFVMRGTLFVGGGTTLPPFDDPLPSIVTFATLVWQVTAIHSGPQRSSKSFP